MGKGKNQKPVSSDAPPATAVEEGYKVAGNVSSITSRRGILVAGESVFPKDFPDGMRTIEALIERGLVVKTTVDKD